VGSTDPLLEADEEQTAIDAMPLTNDAERDVKAKRQMAHDASQTRKLAEAANVITLMCSDEVLSLLSFEEHINGRRYWKKLEEMYRPGGRRRYITLKKELHAMRFNPEKDDIRDFMARATKLEDEINATGVKLTPDLEKILFLLTALPDNYSHIFTYSRFGVRCQMRI
jgi:hypothetical protein